MRVRIFNAARLAAEKNMNAAKMHCCNVFCSEHVGGINGLHLEAHILKPADDVHTVISYVICLAVAAGAFFRIGDGQVFLGGSAPERNHDDGKAIFVQHPKQFLHCGMVIGHMLEYVGAIYGVKTGIRKLQIGDVSPNVDLWIQKVCRYITFAHHLSKTTLQAYFRCKVQHPQM